MACTGSPRGTREGKIFYTLQGRPQDLGGGEAIFFFSDLGICMFASPCAMLGRSGGMPPQKKFFKTVQFGAF